MSKYKREGASLVDNQTGAVVCVITDEKFGNLLEAGLSATAERDRLKESNTELLTALKELYANWREYVDTPNDWQELNEQVEAAINKTIETQII